MHPRDDESIIRDLFHLRGRAVDFGLFDRDVRLKFQLEIRLPQERKIGILSAEVVNLRLFVGRVLAGEDKRFDARPIDRLDDDRPDVIVAAFGLDRHRQLHRRQVVAEIIGGEFAHRGAGARAFSFAKGQRDCFGDDAALGCRRQAKRVRLAARDDHFAILNSDDHEIGLLRPRLV